MWSASGEAILTFTFRRKNEIYDSGMRMGAKKITLADELKLSTDLSYSIVRVAMTTNPALSAVK